MRILIFCILMTLISCKKEIPLAIGDNVHLKTGGPIMVIVNINGDIVTCRQDMMYGLKIKHFHESELQR